MSGIWKIYNRKVIDRMSVNMPTLCCCKQLKLVPLYRALTLSRHIYPDIWSINYKDCTSQDLEKCWSSFDFPKEAGLFIHQWKYHLKLKPSQNIVRMLKIKEDSIYIASSLPNPQSTTNQCYHELKLSNTSMN